jgi:3-deoxy-manno-octulosonate cytidylyltransferase (CMP-KDO synthetase)
MKTLAVIPSRYASTRFPGKPLIDIDGKSMIRRVYEQVSLADRVTKIVVATDDDRIFDQVKNFGGEVKMTNPSHPSGTDRCAEVASQFADFELVINIQGDEPFIKPSQINDLIVAFQKKEASGCGIGTMIKTIEKEADLLNANIVKVVRGINNHALYFSRQAIPFIRNFNKNEWPKKHVFFKHIGMYIFNSKVLQKITKLPTGKLESAENLEQLRWLENGFSIYTTETKYETFGIDTPDDLSNWQKKNKISK